MIGHEGHPEVEGTAGQLQDISKLTLVQELNDVEKLYFPSDQKIAYITQTTLSVFDTQEIVDALEKKFPTNTWHLRNQIFVMPLQIGKFLFRNC